MITEIALLKIVQGRTAEFKIAFQKAEPIINSMKGYLGHNIEQCLEDDHKFLLLVKWQKLEDHTVGFRQSEEYKEWKKLLHHFYDPFPIVEHYQKVEFAAGNLLEA